MEAATMTPPEAPETRGGGGWAEVELTDPVLRQYERYLAVKGIKKVSRDKYQYAAARFQRWLDEQDMCAADVDMLAMMGYANGEGPLVDLAEGTKRAQLVQLRAAYAFAVEEELVPKTPFGRRFQMPKRSDPEHTTLTVEQLRKYQRRARGWQEQLLIGMLMWTGMRRDEIRLLQWSNIDLEAGTITFVGKLDKRRVVPVHPELRKLLKSAPAPMTSENVVRVARGNKAQRIGPVLHTSAGGAYSPNGLRGVLDRIVDEGVSPHWFRRTVATSLDRNGVSASVRDKIMGWAPTTMYGRSYDGLTVDDLQDGIQRLYVREGL